MTFQVRSSLPKLLMYERSSNDSGLDGFRPPGRRQNVHQRSKFPLIKPLGKSKDGRSSRSCSGIHRSPIVGRNDRMERENNDPEMDICGKHFMFDTKCETLQGTRTVIPPLQTDHLHRPGNLRPYNLSKELSHSHAPQPRTLRCELKQNPEILFPSALLLKGRSPFSVQGCKFSRPKVDYPTFNLLPVGDKMKDQSYPDPMIGASRSFIHRISELSSLEGDTVRREKLKKTRKHKKHPS